MKPQRKCIATELLLFLGLLLSSAAALAQQIAGTVTHLSGPLLARKADGAVKVLSQKSVVEQGDTLVTEKDTYARIKFIDNSEITLRPASQLKIDSFAFDEAQPEKDSAVFSLVKGGLRAVTGMLGKRSQEKFGLHTPTATIGIRGTIFIAEYVPPPQAPVSSGPRSYMQASVAAAPEATLLPMHGTRSDVPRLDAPIGFLPPVRPLLLAQENGAAQADAAPGGPNAGPGPAEQGSAAGLPAPGAGTAGTAGTAGVPGANPATGTDPSLGAGTAPGSSRAPGLYVQVLDGMINLSNSGGAQNFAAGQFGYAPTQIDPPVILPANPGMQFTPPPAFSVSTGPQQGTLSASGASGNVDCEVR